ncbi:Uncharacterised protein [Mycobacterium tuberculosis]|nr:Uncharacterised protein [Mycobacterium tuberculosis]CKU16786.1 Uncharacterised protein [Mycobacterium tuberculosis]
MQDVADDHDAPAFDAAEALTDGQRIKQRLRGVFMSAVAGVDHRRPIVVGAGPLRQQMGGAGRGMADDQRVSPGRAQGQRGIPQRLTLAYRRSGSADVDHVGAHPLTRYLERHPGAGGVLIEHRDDGPAPQRRQLLDVATDQRLRKPVGVVEDGGGVVAAEVGGGQQVPWGHREITTPSRPSCSRSRTCTLSLREVGTFLPT